MKNNNAHGDARRKRQTRLYRIWCAMKSRCNNQNFPRYVDYGGRGIEICQEWGDYTVFRDWAFSHDYSDNLSIERKDNNGNYCPKNCKWITLRAQARNRRNNRLLTIFNETKTVIEWSEDTRCVVSHGNLNSRLHKGWDAHQAITEPVKKIKKATPRMVTYQGKTLSINAWCKILGYKPAIIYYRANAGMSDADVLAPIKKIAPYGSKKIHS